MDQCLTSENSCCIRNRYGCIYIHTFPLISRFRSNCYFQQKISGFTTTGATILGDVEALSHASMLWRCLMHWVGGMGILVFMLIVLPLAGGQTIYLMRAESPGPSVSKISPHMRDTALILYAIYFGLTVLQIILLLFGGSLLVDTLRKSKNGTHNSGCFSFHPTRNGGRKKEHCTCTGNFFDCDTAFGENNYTILLPTLGGGSADVSFGSLSVDLQKCEHLGENCTVDLNCAFGELVLIVPGRFRVEPTKSAAFASVSVSGAPDDDAAEVIHVNCDASFGEISIRYV